MKTGTLYTFGYNDPTGWPELERLMERPSSILLDIRFSPRGRPAVCQGAFASRYGDQYRWVQALGNAGYRTRGIRLMDEAAGVAVVRSLLNGGRDAILMCACRDAAQCHRSLVAGLVAEGVPDLVVVHLDAGGRDVAGTPEAEGSRPGPPAEGSGAADGDQLRLFGEQEG